VSPENLLCYKEERQGTESGSDGLPGHEFGQQVRRLGQRREICVTTTLAP
jgi:hypothetical protein